MDDINRKILALLQADARRRNVDLARELGVAPSSMLERIRRLEGRGYFKGFRAILDPGKLGYGVQALVSVSLVAHRTKTIRSFEEGVHRIPHVRVCYHVSGRFDYILLVVAKDVNDLGNLVKEQIASLPGVSQTETFIVFSEIKSDDGYPIEEMEKGASPSSTKRALVVEGQGRMGLPSDIHSKSPGRRRRATADSNPQYRAHREKKGN